MTAARTKAVEFESVGFDDKSVLGCDFFLESLNLLIFEFHDLVTAGADEVVVVALVGDVVVFRLRAEVPGLCDSGITEQIECPIDGSEPKVRIGLCELVIHGLRGDVFLPEEGGQNQFSLAGEFELMFAQVLLRASISFTCFSPWRAPIGPH